MCGMDGMNDEGGGLPRYPPMLPCGAFCSPATGNPEPKRIPNFQIFAICIVIALGLEEEPRTGRWRLLLMSEKEEMQWSHRK
jgi:hypothetical protein